MPSEFLSEIIFIIIAAFFGGFIARSISLPPVLGYIASGILFGNLGRNILDQGSTLLTLSQIGVSLLLFTLGFEVRADFIKKINKQVVLIGISQILITSLLLLPLFWIAKIDTGIALLFSLLFSFSSTAVVVKILEEKGQLFDFPGSSVFSLLLIQDLFVIPAFFFLPIIFSKEGLTLNLAFSFFGEIAKTGILFLGIYLLSQVFLSRILAVLFRYPTHELSLLATIFIATVSIGIFTAAGVPQAISAFLAGILVSEEGKNLAPLSEIRPLRDLFLVLFFVTTGALLDLSFVFQNLMVLVIATVGILLVKFFVTYSLLRFFAFIPSASIFIASNLTNVSEFAAVLGQVAFIEKLISQDSYSYLLSIFIFSLLAIPVITRYPRQISTSLGKLRLFGTVFKTEEYRGMGRTQDLINHVVIAGHGRVGRGVRHLLDYVAIPYIVVDFDRKVMTELLDIEKPAIYGDPTDPEVLSAARLAQARVLVIAVPDTLSQRKVIREALRMNPKVTIICRSHREEERFDLLNLGANTIVIPELEAGMRIGSEVLKIFGVDHTQIESVVKRARRQVISST